MHKQRNNFRIRTLQRTMLTKKDLLEAIEDMPMDAEILIKVDAFTFEPTSDVGLNKELNEIVIC